MMSNRNKILKKTKRKVKKRKMIKNKIRKKKRVKCFTILMIFYLIN